MNVKKDLIILGSLIAALMVVGIFWAIGFYLFYQYGLSTYAVAMYIPGIAIASYLYIGLKNRGYFLEIFAFVLALSLAMMATVDILTYF